MNPNGVGSERASLSLIKTCWFVCSNRNRSLQTRLVLCNIANLSSNRTSYADQFRRQRIQAHPTMQHCEANLMRLHKTSGWASIILIMLTGIPLLVGGEMSLVWQHEARLTIDPGGQLVPVWTGGRLLIVEGSSSQAPIIRAFDQNGLLVSAVSFTIPGADSISVQGRAAGPDGMIAVCGSAVDSQGRAGGYITVISGETSTTTRMFPYIPTAIGVSPDKTIWTAGYEYAPNGKVNRESGTLRHYNLLGTVQKEFVPLVTHKVDAYRTGYLVVKQDHIGWYTGPIWGPGAMYIEVTKGGQVREMSGVPLEKANDTVTGVAMTDDDTVFATTYIPSAKQSKLFVLDRSTAGWKAVDISTALLSQKTLHLYGSQGSRLVANGADRFGMRMFEVQHIQ